MATMPPHASVQDHHPNLQVKGQVVGAAPSAYETGMGNEPSN